MKSLIGEVAEKNSRYELNNSRLNESKLHLPGCSYHHKKYRDVIYEEPASPDPFEGYSNN